VRCSDDGRCVECLADPHCELGLICERNRCAEGCRDHRDCPGGGHCEDGGCQLPDVCESFQDREICGSGVQNRRTYCELLVDMGDDQTTCGRYCRGRGGACIDGWNDIGGTCEHGEHVGCDLFLHMQVCRCIAAGLQPAPNG
jgi:hypothetical protein